MIVFKLQFRSLEGPPWAALRVLQVKKVVVVDDENGPIHFDGDAAIVQSVRCTLLDSEATVSRAAAMREAAAAACISLAKPCRPTF